MDEEEMAGWWCLIGAFDGVYDSWQETNSLVSGRTVSLPTARSAVENNIFRMNPALSQASLIQTMYFVHHEHHTFTLNRMRQILPAHLGWDGQHEDNHSADHLRQPTLVSGD